MRTENQGTTIDPEVQRYLDAIPAAKRPLFDRLQALILELYPTAEIGISYHMPVYRVGRGRVFLGVWKQGVSIHGVPVEGFKERHPAIKTGRGSLNFKVTDALPEADLRDVIKEAIGRWSAPA